MDVLQRTFLTLIVSWFSPDLVVCDFFLWGYLKSHIYVNKPCTLEELKDAIHRDIQTIDQQTLERVWVNFKVRVAECIDEGYHLSEIILKHNFSGCKMANIFMSISNF